MQQGWAGDVVDIRYGVSRVGVHPRTGPPERCEAVTEDDGSLSDVQSLKRDVRGDPETHAWDAGGFIAVPFPQNVV